MLSISVKLIHESYLVLNEESVQSQKTRSYHFVERRIIGHNKNKKTHTRTHSYTHARAHTHTNIHTRSRCYLKICNDFANKNNPELDHRLVRNWRFPPKKKYRLYFIIPSGKIGPPYLGKATAAARAALLTQSYTEAGACWVFSCFCNPPTSDTDYRIFN